MKRVQRWWVVLGLSLLGCDGFGDATAVPIEGVDGAVADAAPADAAPADAAPADAVVLDATLSVDAASLDTAVPDAAVPDAAVPDAAVPDAAVPDAAVPDAAVPDAAVPDAAVARCAPLPAACGAVTPDGVAEHHLEAVPGCAFALQRTGDVAAAQALADAIGDRANGVRSIDQVLQQLNRVTRPGITAAAADRLRNHDYLGVRWNNGDDGTEAWYPQGVTGSEDAWAAGHRRRLLMVSWYDHDAGDGIEKGARISLVDLTDLNAARYRHLLLVVPRATAGGVSFDSLQTDAGGSLHAGGIVWLHPWLYVADTSQGFRVFDLDRIIEVPDTDDSSRIGVSANRVDAHAYRYIVPQVARYQLAPGGCAARFSFVGLDRSAVPPVLVSGEYHRDDVEGRVIRWAVDPQTGWLLEDEPGVVRAVDAAVSGQTRLQGALTWQGDTYLSASSQTNGLGRLYRTRAGLESRISAWPRGCEDLYLERSTDYIWTATEYPDERDVVGIPRRAP